MTASSKLSSKLPKQFSGKEVLVISLISAGHFLSHFYVICLAPLLLQMAADLKVGFAELGLISTAFFAAGATCQMPAGILVDRIGARRVLFVGMFILSIAITFAGLTTSYWGLLGLFMLAGVGNCVFHPCDYVILSSSVDEKYLGRAFSIHSFCGSAGFAISPVTMAALAVWFDWRTSLLIVGVGGLILALIILTFQFSLKDSVTRKNKGKGQLWSTWHALISRRILSHFVYFTTSSAATSALTAFTVVVLVAYYGVSEKYAGAVLTAYLISASIGVIFGGILADRTKRHDLVLIITMLVAAISTGIAATGILSFWLCTLALMVAGLTKGIVAPSRDLMVRNDAPAALLGSVVAFVTVGFTFGNGLAPVIAGWFVDKNAALGVFWMASGLALTAISCVLIARRSAPPK